LLFLVNIRTVDCGKFESLDPTTRFGLQIRSMVDWLPKRMISLRSSAMLLPCACLNSWAILGSSSLSTCVNSFIIHSIDRTDDIGHTKGTKSKNLIQVNLNCRFFDSSLNQRVFWRAHYYQLIYLKIVLHQYDHHRASRVITT
jgi:hypothetical protein